MSELPPLGANFNLERWEQFEPDEKATIAVGLAAMLLGMAASPDMTPLRRAEMLLVIGRMVMEIAKSEVGGVMNLAHSEGMLLRAVQVLMSTPPTEEDDG